jgi:methionyl-tRNA formyltransferase
LKIPAIGTLNRHGALLPKYRGRLAPFWAYLCGERSCGVSIHFVQRAVDAGPIVVQKRFPIGRFDTVDSLVAKVFRHAPEAMLEALDILRSGDYDSRLLPNDDARATYFSSPTLRDALRYRLVMLRRMLLGR